jgi:uncharacterized protein (UPF0332 family)
MDEPLFSEFSYRNASSRAYYALFHAAKQRLEALGVPFIQLSKGGSHETVICTIEGIGSVGRGIADDMRRVKRIRHPCDYDNGENVSRKRAHQLLPKPAA